MSKFKAIFPFIHDMGSVSPMIVKPTVLETKEEQALWQLNSMRRHDGLPEYDLDDFKKLRVKFERIEE